MNTVTKLLTALALLGLGLLAHASDYDTFLSRKERTGLQAADELLNARGQQALRKADLFFSAAGITSRELRTVIASERLEDRVCDACRMETAGIKGGRVEYHRFVRSDEMVTYLVKPDRSRVPLFLPACGNPVRDLSPPPVPVVQQPVTVTPRCVEEVTYVPGTFYTPGAGFGPYGYGGTGFGWVGSHHRERCW